MLKFILNSKIFRYGSALVLSCGVIVLKEFHRDYLGEGTPFILVFTVIIISTFIGGFGPGIVSVIITVFFAIYFFIPPYYSIVISPQAIIPIVASLTEGVTIVILIYYLKRYIYIQKQSNKELEKRVAERTVELNAFNVELERSNKELQDFAHIASHDLQEPLRKIQTFGNLLKTEHADTLHESGKDYLERMNHAATRMRILIDDLLLFSRVTSKANPPEEVDLNKIIQEILVDLEVRIRDLDAMIEVQNLQKVKADPSQMRQLFQNIISNSLKFHKENTKPIIKISGRFTAGIKHDTLYEVVIEDNGIGFDPKYSEKIFNIFERLHSRQEYQGTGIGLAISKKIVDRHGWGIRAESKVGEGTTFIITIPYIQK